LFFGRCLAHGEKKLEKLEEKKEWKKRKKK
jgi:hypothetical protein